LTSGAQAVVEEAAPDVNRVHARRAALEEAIREAARGRAHVRADQSGHVNVEAFERGFQFLPAPAHEARPRFDRDHGVVRDRGGGPVHHLPIHRDLPGHDQPPGLLAGLGQAEGMEALVEAGFGHPLAVSEQ